MAGILRAWAAVAEQRPLLTVAATNGALAGLGDLLAQSIESRGRRQPLRWDGRRTLRLVAWGAACAPVFFRWYAVLGRAFPLPPASLQRRSATYLKAVAKRVAADQIVYAPAGIAAFFVAMALMEGRSLDVAAARLRERFAPTLAANYAVWPAVQAVNLGLVPPIYRVPFGSVVGIFWNAFMSWANARAAAATAAAKPGVRAPGPRWGT
ncbi:hypothetical protein IWQ56_005882 [Coemansia nantahalensis]|uniref:Uncharacterized protein n=1 Tax=Coemansia nantahalensis TaxID=2789366 RepID=A0ACC1JM93_9FUNG|nr:hypothetical protein IWQ56_005882 [Coemansia nantahalensis]KAJ2763313.1 hypothetical protein IWQ57_005591 [Coemansia nantahalensis]